MGPNSVFYTTDTNALPATEHTIRRVNGVTGTVEVIDTGNGGPGGIETDATYVYYAIQGNPNSQVYRKAHTASATVPPELFFSTPAFPTYLVVRGGTSYWMSSTNNTAPFYVFKRSLTAQMSDQGTQVTTTSETGRPFAFVATSTTLYWTLQAGTSLDLRELPIGATTVTDVAGAPGSPSTPLHADQKKVYWAVRAGGPAQGVYSHYSGGGVAHLSSTEAGVVMPDPLSDQVYFGDPFILTPLYKVNKSGGPTIEISAQLFGYDFIGTDSRFVYIGGQWGSVNPAYRYVK
jgi:hypothetical protein